MHQPARLFHQAAGGPARRLAVDLALACALALFLAATRAFGLAIPFGGRLLYWLLLLLGPVVLGRLAFDALGRVRGLQGSILRRGGLLVALSTLVATPLVWALTGWLVEGRLEARWLPRFLLWVLLVNAAVTAVAILAHQFRRPAAPRPTAAEPALRERLPLQFRDAAILAVEAQGHALRVHTDQGAPLIWLGLRRAIAELEPLAGLQAHKSWWVADAAIVRVDRVGRRAVIGLSNGVRVPVSRARLGLLRERGLV